MISFFLFFSFFFFLSSPPFSLRNQMSGISSRVVVFQDRLKEKNKSFFFKPPTYATPHETSHKVRLESSSTEMRKCKSIHRFCIPLSTDPTIFSSKAFPPFFFWTYSSSLSLRREKEEHGSPFTFVMWALRVKDLLSQGTSTYLKRRKKKWFFFLPRHLSARYDGHPSM